MGCPICGSGHILLALGEGGRATCQRCGASWSGQSPLEEKEAAVPFPIPRGPRHTVEIPVRGASAFEVGMEIVSMLVRDHGATVLEYDIGTAGGSLRLRLPVPTSVGTTHHRSQRAIEVAVTVGQGVVVVDRELRVRVWNPQAEELWGLRSDEVLGKQFTNLDIGLPVGDLKSMLVSCLHDGGRQQSLDVPAVTRRGKAIRSRVTCTPLQGTDERSRGVIVVMEELGASS